MIKEKIYTGQYVTFEIQNPWNYKIRCIQNLVRGVNQICSTDLLPAKIQDIKKFTSGNGFSNLIRNSVTKRTLSKSYREELLEDNNDTIKLCINLTDITNTREQLA